MAIVTNDKDFIVGDKRIKVYYFEDRLEEEAEELRKFYEKVLILNKNS